uniref:Mid2 domain-containing protein n=1 Tax=Bionectria ochroleuca TaxID=29856 RepID=A0A8H7N5P5_BIOOC
MHGIFFASLLLHLVPRTLAASNSTCYFSNSNVAKNDVPCDPNAEASVCCSKEEGTVCLENGLCQNSGGHKSRGSCTDQNWNSEYCPQFCLDTDASDGVGMKSCSSTTKKDTSYCCWYSADSCCSTGINRIELLPSSPGIWASYDNSSSSYDVVKSRTLVSSSSTQVSTSTSSSSSSTSTATSSATTTTSASSPTSTSDESNSGSSSGGLTTGAKAGIGVGVALGVIALLCLGFFLNRWYEAKKRAAAQAQEQEYPHSPGKYSELASWGTSQSQAYSSPHGTAYATPHVTPHSASPPYDPRYPVGPSMPPVEMPTRHTPAVEMPAH